MGGPWTAPPFTKYRLQHTNRTSCVFLNHMCELFWWLVWQKWPRLYSDCTTEVWSSVTGHICRCLCVHIKYGQNSLWDRHCSCSFCTEMVICCPFRQRSWVSVPAQHLCIYLRVYVRHAHSVQQKAHYVNYNDSIYSHHRPCICRDSEAWPSASDQSGRHPLRAPAVALLAYPTYAGSGHPSKKMQSLLWRCSWSKKWMLTKLELTAAVNPYEPLVNSAYT